MKDTITWDQSIETLYRIPVVRLEIGFHATMNLQTEGIEPAFRGRLGFKLKQSWCLYDDFRNANCLGCNLINQCRYVRLFSPDIRKSQSATQK